LDPRGAQPQSHPTTGLANRPRTAELCCVLAIAGNQHYPPSWVEALILAGISGYWVGHSSGSFAVGLMSDREPGLVSGSRGITSPGSRSEAGSAPGIIGHARPGKKSNCFQERHALPELQASLPSPLFPCAVQSLPGLTTRLGFQASGSIAFFPLPHRDLQTSGSRRPPSDAPAASGGDCCGGFLAWQMLTLSPGGVRRQGFARPPGRASVLWGAGLLRDVHPHGLSLKRQNLWTGALPRFL
jgi:hypothetical protein